MLFWDFLRNVLSADMLLAMADNPVVLWQIQFLK
jgi:hypothetical protein